MSEIIGQSLRQVAPRKMSSWGKCGRTSAKIPGSAADRAFRLHAAADGRVMRCGKVRCELLFQGFRFSEPGSSTKQSLFPPAAFHPSGASGHQVRVRFRSWLRPGVEVPGSILC